MHYVGIDLHKVHSQVCVVNDDGTIVQEVRIPSTIERFVELFSEIPRAVVLLESSAMSEWVARTLEGLDRHEVVVGAPGYALMYGARNPKVKTDLRDARALAEACRVGAYRPAYRANDVEMRMRRRLSVRRLLVETRARLIQTTQGLIRQLGVKVPGGAPEKFPERIERTELPADFRETVAPVVATLRTLNEQIEFCDEVVSAMAKHGKATAVLNTVPGVGPVTACTFAAVIGDVSRFTHAHQVQSYLGLVPSEYSSGERKIRGKITRRGNPYLRSLLVQTAVRILRYRQASTAELWTWATRIAERRGKFVARVALARRLAGVMFAMMRDLKPFMPMRGLATSASS